VFKSIVNADSAETIIEENDDVRESEEFDDL
jgi:hypothetical protein